MCPSRCLMHLRFAESLRSKQKYLNGLRHWTKLSSTHGLRRSLTCSFRVARRRNTSAVWPSHAGYAFVVQVTRLPRRLRRYGEHVHGPTCLGFSTNGLGGYPRVTESSCLEWSQRNRFGLAATAVSSPFEPEPP